MWIYWFLFIFVAWTALSKMYPVFTDYRVTYQKIPGLLWFCLLVLLIGFRYEVGGDWFSYLRMVEDYDGALLKNSLSLGSDPGYNFLNWVGGNVWGGIYFVNVISAAIFAWGLLLYCRFQPRPELSLLVAVPFLIIVVSMGYTRQSVAIGLIMASLVALQNGYAKRFILFVVLAALFHKTAIIFMLFAVFYRFRNRFIIILTVFLSFLMIFLLLLQDYVMLAMGYYFDTKYNSSGAGVRVAMNALPAMLFLIWRRRFHLSLNQRNFWTWVSWIALAFVPLLFLLPSSTVVDRMALYWIPLQIMVWSHAPDVLGWRGRRNAFWVYSIVTYSGFILFIWIFFADHRMEWLPYQFYPWVKIWM